MYKLERMVEISRALRQRKECGINFHTTFAFRKNRLLAIGITSAKTHPRNLRLPHFNQEENLNYAGVANIHSELSCALKLGLEDCSDISFVNIRLGHNDELRMAKPCRACQALFNQLQFRRVLYSTAGGDLEQFK